MPASESAGTQRSDLPPALIGPNSLRLAAAKGDPSAEFEVGARFAEGKGVPQDFKQAVDWYTRAAGRGLAIAQYRLATLYERGLGVKADPGRAKAWYGRAAELGNVKAMHNLAVMAAGHSQGGQDYATAVRWFTEAADRGLADSQYNLAILHESGLGTPKDPKLAYVWLSLASRGGDKEAMRRRDVIKKSLPADALRSADEMVAGWSMKPTDLLANEAKAAGEAWKMRHAVQPGG
jgi:localization factor PodJL